MSDYTEALALYVRGYQLPAISQALGVHVDVLRDWKIRHGWDAEKERTEKEKKK